MTTDKPVSRILYYGPWHIAYKATNVLCPDGRYRTARLTREADTFFTIPAQVKVKGKTVSGFITGKDDGLTFVQSQTGKNNHLFWASPDAAADYLKALAAGNGYYCDYAITAPNWTARLTRPHNHGPYTVTVTLKE